MAAIATRSAGQPDGFLALTQQQCFPQYFYVDEVGADHSTTNAQPVTEVHGSTDRASIVAQGCATRGCDDGGPRG